MTVTDDDALDRALDWVTEGRRVAVATVVETWGSAPRPRGSHLVVRDDGLFRGSVSGGCVEGKVVEAAQTAMEDRCPRVLEFGVSDDEAWEVGLACGGTVRIYVQPVEAAQAAGRGPLGTDVLEAVRDARVRKQALVLLTPLDGRSVRAWRRGDPPLEAELRDAADRALATDEASTVETAGGPVFVQAMNPVLRLVIVGAVHIAEALARMASLVGYAVTLVDPRPAFARAERWPGFTVVPDWPDEAFSTMDLDSRTAVVALTHDPKIDDPALDAALRSAAFYVGALGSTKTHAARLRRLAAAGHTDETLARIHGPVGLRIGARTPGEIAVSIVAQMTEVLRGGRRSTKRP